MSPSIKDSMLIKMNIFANNSLDSLKLSLISEGSQFCPVLVEEAKELINGGVCRGPAFCFGPFAPQYLFVLGHQA